MLRFDAARCDDGGGWQRRHSRGQQGCLLLLSLGQQHRFVLALRTHEVNGPYRCQGDTKDEAQQTQRIGNDACSGRDAEQGVLDDLMAQHRCIVYRKCVCGLCFVVASGLEE